MAHGDSPALHPIEASHLHALRERVFLGLMNEGILTAPNLVGALSTPITEAEVDVFLGAYQRVLERQNPR